MPLEQCFGRNLQYQIITQKQKFQVNNQNFHLKKLEKGKQNNAKYEEIDNNVEP